MMFPITLYPAERMKDVRKGSGPEFRYLRTNAGLSDIPKCISPRVQEEKKTIIIQLTYNFSEYIFWKHDM